MEKEIQHQFEAKLREAKQQRTQVEEELESVSERWRNERRRLNAEVDRLESALSEARESRKRALGAKADRGIDPLEVAKIQSSADEKIRKASKAWDAEREKLLKEISRLQRAVGDLIERSNNPLRATMPVVEELETKLTEAVRAKERVESGFLREKALWDEEKLRMTGELIKLRHLVAQNSALKGKLDAADRAKELESRISAMQTEMERERAEWRVQIQQLERGLDDTRQTVNAEVVEQLRRQYDDRLQEMILQKSQLTEELKSASALLEAERSRFATAAGSGHEVAVVAEVARVQNRIADIGKLIENPSTELSMVIRKNVERVELNAYLEGIRFSMGSGNGL